MIMKKNLTHEGANSMRMCKESNDKSLMAQLTLINNKNGK